MPKFGDRVKETTDTSGTGTLDLSGAPTGFRSFSDEFNSGDADISYLIVDNPDNPTEYEVGKGTFTAGTPDTLARNTVEKSSNGGSKVSFAAGTKTVIATPTASDFNIFGGDGPWASKTAIVRSITATGAMLAADDGKLIIADGSGNSPPGLTYNLIAAATADDGFVVTVINVGASGAVTIDGSGAETINGATTLTLPGQYSTAKLRCDGTKWHAEVSAGNVLTTAWDLPVRGASGVQRLALGATDGMVIGRQSGAVAYVHQGWELVDYVDLTASTITFADLAAMEDGYKYILDYRNVQVDPVTGGNNWLAIQLQTSGGSMRTGASDYESSYEGVGALGSNNVTDNAMILHASPITTSTDEWYHSGEIQIFGAMDSGMATAIIGQHAWHKVNGAQHDRTCGVVNTVEANDVIRFTTDQGVDDFTDGELFLWRIREPE